MTISEATIREFQQVVKEDYGKELTLPQASEILATLVGYFELLNRIDARKNENEYGKPDSKKTQG